MDYIDILENLNNIADYKLKDEEDKKTIKEVIKLLEDIRHHSDELSKLFTS